jgi:hypothetical protein
MIEEGNTFIENVFREGKEIEPSKFHVKRVNALEGGGESD